MTAALDQIAELRAQAAYRDAIAVGLEAVRAAEGLDRAMLLVALARLFLDAGDHTTAASAADDALGLLDEVADAPEGLAARAVGRLLAALQAQGAVEDALAVVEAGAALLGESEPSPGQAELLSELARWLARNGDAAALEAAAGALALTEGYADSLDRTRALLARGVALAAEEEHAGAWDALTRALHHAAEVAGEGTVEVAQACLALAEVGERCGRTVEAAEHRERGRAILAGAFGDDHPLLTGH